MQGVVGGLRARRYWRRVVLAAVAIAALLCDVGGVDGRRTALAQSQPPALTQKLNAYVGCINRLSERSYSSRSRYFSWVGKKGPTGRERIIYGTYTIYDTTDCAKKVSAANALEPREPDLETAASAFATAGESSAASPEGVGSPPAHPTPRRRHATAAACEGPEWRTGTRGFVIRRMSLSGRG